MSELGELPGPPSVEDEERVAPEPALPDVSVLIPTCNGRSLLETCLLSLAEIDYPREHLAVLVYDNGSSDGTREWLAAAHPEVRVLATERNDGFAAPCNRLAAAAASRRVCFLNNDVRVAPDFLRALVAAAEGTGAACVGGRILSSDGERIEFDGGTMSLFGHGAPRGYGTLAASREGEVEPFPSLFACGAAMLVDRDVFLDAGGFDEGYFAYYEDVDLGWRLWILGEECVIAPAARVFHREHGTEAVLPPGRRLALLERNALIGVAKNYENERALRVLHCALALLGERARLATDPARRRACTEGLVAAIDGLPGAELRRAELRERRRRSDVEVAPLFGDPWQPAIAGEEYARRQRELAALFGAGDLFPVETAGGARTGGA